MKNLHEGINQITVKEYLQRCSAGGVQFYEKNRGVGKTSTKTSKAVEESFNPHAIGMVVGCLTNGALVLADAHSRTEGLKNRWKRGLFSNKELNSTLVINVIPEKEFQRTYCDVNTSEGHTARNKLDNSDLPFGKLLEEVLLKSGVSEENKNLFRKFRPQLANVVYAVSRGETKDYPTIFCSRNHAKKYFNVVEDNQMFKISSSDRKRLIAAISYYKELIESLKNQCPLNKKGTSPNLNVDIKAILRSSAFFGFLVGDGVSDNQKITNIKPSTIARKLYKNSGTVVRWIKSLTHGSSDDMIEISAELVRRLKA